MPESKMPSLHLSPIPAQLDIKELNTSVRKIAAIVNKSAAHTERIPEICSKMEATGDKVIELGVKLEHVGERVSKVEGKVDAGHKCNKDSDIRGLKVDQKETSTKVEQCAIEWTDYKGRLNNVKKQTTAVEADVEEIKKAPRRMFLSLVGVVMTVISGIGGAVWFLAVLSKEVEFERRERTQQMGRIERHIKKVGAKSVNIDMSDVEKEIKVLEQTVRQAQSDESFDMFCLDMNYNERRAIRRLLQVRGKAIPESCRR